MHADKQPFVPPPNCGCRILSLFFADATIEFPFCVNPSIRPSVVRSVLLWETERKLCLKQLPEWTERDTPLPNPSVNKFDICPHFARGAVKRRSARKSGSVRTPIYGVLFERGNKELSLLDIAPHLPIYQAKERDFQHLHSPEGERWKGNWG